MNAALMKVVFELLLETAAVCLVYFALSLTQLVRAFCRQHVELRESVTLVHRDAADQREYHGQMRVCLRSTNSIHAADRAVEMGGAVHVVGYRWLSKASASRSRSHRLALDELRSLRSLRSLLPPSLPLPSPQDVHDET